MDLHFHDTIVALATPRDHSSIAVVRVSGENAIRIVADHTTPNVFTSPTHTIHHSRFKNSTHVDIDDVLVSVFRSPKTYTGEDIVEISLHGNPLLADEIISSLISSGCRVADNGEFTKRAFINGKIDLSQAESIAALISSSSIHYAQAQVEVLKGSLSKFLSVVKMEILDLRSYIETEIDFSEDHLVLLDRTVFSSRVSLLISKIDSLIENFDRRKIYLNEIRVAIIGPPNSGKSSLMNSILQYERSIVSNIPGTTRDYVDDVISYHGHQLRFIDTAGIRATKDPVESAGIFQSDRIHSSADIVLLVVDGTSDYNEQVDFFTKKEKKFLLVINKSDLIGYHFQNTYNFNSFEISAKNSTGIENLLDFITNMINEIEGMRSYLPLINTRHRECLLRCREFLLSSISNSQTSDIIGLDLRYASDAVSEITGEIYTDDILDNIFSKFCIGK